MPATDQLAIRIAFPRDLVDDPEALLTEAGATDVARQPPRPGLAPVIAIVVAAVIGVHGLAELILRLRDKHRAQQVVDLRGGEVKTTVNEDVRDGRIVVVTEDGKVEIVEAPRDFKLEDVLTAALKDGADAAKAAAKDAGAQLA